ncbi:MAG: VirD4-like conjugal transfer protein, CD1115 family [Lachnospiraceae bacterium]
MKKAKKSSYKTRIQKWFRGLRSKEQSNKIEYVLSTRPIVISGLVLIDLVLLAAFNFASHMIWNLPALIQGRVTSEELTRLRWILPDEITLGKLLIPLAIVLLLDIYVLYKIHVSWSDKGFNLNQKGEQRMTYPEEIKAEYLEVSIMPEMDSQGRLLEYKGNPGFPVSRIKEKLYLDTMVVNNFFIGITRSGKDQIYVLISVELYSRAEYKPSLVINDAKIETYKAVAPLLEQRGYDVYILNCSNPAMSMGFNPLQLVVEYYKKKDYDTAEMVANSFSFSYFNADAASNSNESYFVNAAVALCTAMIWAAVDDAMRADEIENQERLFRWKGMTEEEKERHPFQWTTKHQKTINMYSIIISFTEMVTTIVDKFGKTRLDEYFEMRPMLDRAKIKWTAVKIAPGKTKAGVFSEMLRELDIFTLTNVAKMTAESSLDLRDIGFGKRPVAIFMATPSYDKALYKIPSLFVRQVYYALGKTCDDGKGECERQVKFLLNECGNMPKIEILDTMVSMGLGQNISFDFYFQNYEQVPAKYGDKEAETIKGNCGNHIYIQTRSEDTAKEVSGQLGNKSTKDIQRSGSKLDWSKHYIESIQEKPLLDHNRLMQFMEGESLILRTSKRRDLKGGKIKPRPIHNSVENGQDMKYAYEYLYEVGILHNPKKVNFLESCKESREHINVSERVWDYRRSFELFTEDVSIVRIRHLDTDGIEKLHGILHRALGMHYNMTHALSDEMSIAQFLAEIFRISGEELSVEDKRQVVYTLMEAV